MAAEETKRKIRQYALDLGVDDVGFANIEDYSSPQMIGFQYTCFKCYTSCPIGNDL